MTEWVEAIPPKPPPLRVDSCHLRMGGWLPSGEIAETPVNNDESTVIIKNKTRKIDKELQGQELQLVKMKTIEERRRQEEDLRLEEDLHLETMKTKHR